MKFAVALLASAALASLVPAPVAAQSSAQRDTIDTTLPTQLPRTAIPHHYALTVTPHAQKLTFDGQVAIDLAILTATNQLTLNAADLSFASATVRAAKGGAAIAARVAVDADAQTATFTFPRSL